MARVGFVYGVAIMIPAALQATSSWKECFGPGVTPRTRPAGALLVGHQAEP